MKPAAPLRKGELHGSTVHRLRELIITGELAPGERLNELALCERLEVSRTPVRDAIKALIQEGLLQAQPNRSPIVVPLEAGSTAELIEVLAGIEGLAGELAAPRIEAAQIARLRSLHDAMQSHHREDALPDYFAANRAFHRGIVEYSGNAVLLWVWDMLAPRVDRARYASNLNASRWRMALAEHGEILERLATGDAEGLGAALRGHVRNGLSSLVDTLSQPATSAAPEAAARPGNPVLTSDNLACKTAVSRSDTGVRTHRQRP
ncbi:MAG: GntR family transcriptional regulator [Burkholderiaceae bacterium]